jgi:gamma-glutamyl-gamma-aminobutyrate hydrolase PuuD
LKLIGITQRVELVSSYNERRDCLDQQWFKLAEKLNLLATPLPNVPADAALELVNRLNLDGVILSGGNTITEYSNPSDLVAPERDAFEEAIVSHAIANDLPILAVCRGMQFINVLFGGKLLKVENHVGGTHAIAESTHGYEFPDTVNSYHNWGIDSSSLADGLIPLAYDLQDNIEAFKHEEHRILGIMWHPEREIPFNNINISLIENFLV